MKKIFFSILILIFCISAGFAEETEGVGIGADKAFPFVKKILKTIPITSDKMYCCTDKDVEKLIETAAEIEINIFELLDCTYRYLSENKMRIEIKGSSLQRLMDTYDYGETRVLLIMPVPLIDKIETGFLLEKNQKPLQVFLTQKYERFVDIGTVFYEKEFGFNRLEPRFFYDAYGMKIKYIGIKVRIKKIHFYGNGLGAIYAKGFFKPKKAWLWIILRKKSEN